MNSFFETLSSATFFGVTLTLVAYSIGLAVKKKMNFSILNPLVISMAIIIVFLKLTNIEYATYNKSANLISYLLTPATVCLAVPLYEKLKLLRDNLWAVLVGLVSGILANIVTIWGVCVLANLDKTIFATMLPKSVTTAIGMAVSDEMGGVVNITVAMIVITGITGNVMAQTIFKLFKVKNPIAKGLAIGNSSHVLGTSKAIELGETEGAMSGLAVAVAGIITVIIVPMVVSLY